MSSPVLARRPPPPVSSFIVTGFLGAGKTTLLNRLLREPDLADTMVLINEFGEIGLDHLLIERVDGDLMLMQSGCICCTIRGDLVEMLEDLLRRMDNGRIRPFRRLIVETTGLADPAPVLHTFMSHPYLTLRYRLDGVVTLVDAVNGAATLAAHPEAVKQAAVADRLAMAKLDLVSEAAAGALRSRLVELNPAAPILDAAAVGAERLLDSGLFDPAGKIADVQNWLNAEALVPPHHHHHDRNRHGAGIRAWCFTSAAAVSPGSLDLFLELLRHAHGPKLLRVKGIVAVSDDLERPLIVQGVQHVFHPPVRLGAWPSEDRSTRMVFIARDLDAAFVEGLWGAFAGVARPDAADAAALRDNPLSLASGGLLR